MNIFYLSHDPKLAAIAHCNKHVVKMILESAQILCTVINKCAGEQVMPYKTTHRNHPCTLWAGKSLENAQWLLSLTSALNEQYRLRFNHDVDHKSYAMLCDNNISKLLHFYLPATGFTTPALAMPDEFKCGDPVKAYRNYYSKAKRDLLQYTVVDAPSWLAL